MKRKGVRSAIFLAFALLFSACGTKNPIPELHLVPGTALLHMHLEPGINSSIRLFAGEQTSGFILADSLLKRGPLGLTLVGIDITTLEPQLLMLTQNATPEYTTALAARELDLDPKQEENRVDLISQQGYARASVASRDGWTALYIGPAPHITLNSWLELESDGSLAADTSLAKVIPDNSQITILFSRNLFGFLSLLPLERQISWWSVYKSVAESLKPTALSLSFSWPETGTEDPLQAGLMLARRDGGVTALNITMSDTRINPDSCFVLLLNLAEGIYD
jgi:hypothetical protein